MMANRHKNGQFKKGGRVVYEGAGSNVEHEAEEKKRGGKVAFMAGGKVAPRMDKRARGGGVGSNNHPFSSAHIKGG
jgi:hypothetical protein